MSMGFKSSYFYSLINKDKIYNSIHDMINKKCPICDHLYNNSTIIKKDQYHTTHKCCDLVAKPNGIYFSFIYKGYEITTDSILSSRTPEDGFRIFCENKWLHHISYKDFYSIYKNFEYKSIFNYLNKFIDNSIFI